MNIIPVFPASQQGTASPPTGPSAGNGATGFDDIFGRELQLPAERSPFSEQDTQSANLNQSISRDPHLQSAANNLFPITHQDSSLGEMVEDLLEVVKPADTLDIFQSVENAGAQFVFSIPISLLGSRDGVDSAIPLAGEVAGSFSDFRAIPADIPASHTSHDQAEQAAKTFSIVVPTAADRWADSLQPLLIPTNQSAQQPFDAAAPRRLTFGHHSSTSPFFAGIPETHELAAAKPSIHADFSMTAETILLGSTPHPPIGNSTPVNPTAIAPAPQVSESHSLKIAPAVDGNGLFSEKSPVSFLLSVQPESLRNPGATAPTAQTSLLLQELQKVIADNNDSLTITATHQRRPVSEHAIKNFFSRHVQLSADQQNNAGGNLLKAGTSALTGVEQNIAQVTMQSGTDSMHPPVTQRFNEQFLNTQSRVAEQNSRNSSDNQTLQQHSQSQDGTSLQQAPGTAPTGSTSTAEQTALSSTFGSQFTESGSAQNADAVKTATANAPHLNQIHDQEIINQIVERFNLHSRQQTSRLSLQLHPAELGELKIDLIVKGDALKANIYTQTQRAGEIIDRNLSRLREILQEQGISVDELVVSFKSEGADDFTPHQGRLFQDQGHLFNQQQKQETASTFAQTIEDTLLSGSVEPSGVNLTI